MKKIIFFVFLFIILTTSFILFSQDNCRTIELFKPKYSFKSEHIKTCFSVYNFKQNIKNIVRNYPFLYNLGKKLFSPPIKRNTYVTKLSSTKIDKIQEFDEDIPFIQGLINKENTNLSVSKAYTEESILEYKNWHRSHGGNWNTKYDHENFINHNNISKLKLIWEYSSINNNNFDQVEKLEKDNNTFQEKKWKGNIELNPIFINNKLIFVTADWKIVAIDLKSKKPLWQIQSILQPSRRGILALYDEKINLEVLYINIGSRVYKINTEDGKKIKEFGENGSVEAFSKVAPMIYNERLVIVSPYHVQMFDSVNGKLIDRISVHPKGKNFNEGRVWAGVALDKNKGIVFINTGNPGPALYGVHRRGKNKRSSSVVAVDLNKKKVLWDFQETIHDLWDLDIASPPILHNLRINNKIYEVVISLSKTGNTLILERNSGKPIFDITYKRAPKSTVPNEIASPYQIKLAKPEPFSKIEYSLSDIDKLSEAKQKQIKKKLRNAKYGWYETPSFLEDLIMYGTFGGAEWTGGALDPVNQHLYIPVNNVPFKVRPYMQSSELNTSFPKKIKDFHNIYIKKCSSCHGKIRNGVNIQKGEKQIKFIPSLVGFFTLPNGDKKFSQKNLVLKHANLNLRNDEIIKLKKLFDWWDNEIIKNNKIWVKAYAMGWSQFLTDDDLPATNPPWGYIAKLDLVSGNILWKTPVGYLKKNGEKIKIGTPIFGGLALNSSGILFATGTDDNLAYAIDAKTGKEIWSYQMDAAGSAPPIIFNYNGKQYVSFLSTGGMYHNYKEKASSIYTFGIVE
jgi:quinoprotein glucose dehydrogenase